MVLLSLYDICFNYLAEHTEDITDLAGIPFNPVVKDLVSSLFSSEKSNNRLNSSILSTVGKSHGSYLTKLKAEWTTIDLLKGTTAGSELPTLVYISKHFSKYVTRLCISYTDIQDNDILLLNGFTHLTSLNLDCSPNITDTAITYITRMNENNNMPFLESIFLASNKQITDRSLRYIARMKSLCFVNLSDTGITVDIAKTYLSKQGFQYTQSKTKVWSGKLSERLHQSLIHWVDSVQPDRNKRLSQWSFSKKIDKHLYFKRVQSLCIPSEPTHPEKRKTNTTDKTTKPKIINKRTKINTMDYFSMIEAEFNIK